MLLMLVLLADIEKIFRDVQKDPGYLTQYIQHRPTSNDKREASTPSRSLLHIAYMSEKEVNGIQIM